MITRFSFLTLFALTLAWSSSLAQPSPRAEPTDAKKVARAYSFKDPQRKIKNEKGELVAADLRPLFAWANSRKGGASPMPAWKRFEVTITEHIKDGMLVANSSDNLTFHIRNYPYKLPAGTLVQLFVVDIGIYEHKPSGASPASYHSFDYGIPYDPAAEKKVSASSKKESTPSNSSQKK